MTFPVPESWTKDTKASLRDETKRRESPASYFFSQGRSLVLAAEYFHDDRLLGTARGGVAANHRHKIHLALFGQLMASFEYLLKDFIAKAIDVSDLFDEEIIKAKWIEVDAGRVLASRAVATTPGSVLIHPTMGWHTPETVNKRYEELFKHRVFEDDELGDLGRFWILRHSVAHNAGFVIHHDAARIGSSLLSEKVANVDEYYISSSFNFLSPIAQRIAEKVGDKVLCKWLQSTLKDDSDYARDEAIYQRLKKLATYVDSRTQDMPTIGEGDYLDDVARVQGTNDCC